MTAAEAFAVTDLSEGDVARALVVLNNSERGDFTVPVVGSKAADTVKQACLKDCWDGDWSRLWRAVGCSRPRLTRLFKQAHFDLSYLPRKVEVWRGGTITPAMEDGWIDIAWGMSWTLNRDIACWFATKFWASRRKGEPCVVKRAVPRSHLLAHIDTRQEDEVLIVRSYPSKVDGNLADWTEAGQRHEEKLRLAEEADSGQ